MFYLKAVLESTECLFKSSEGSKQIRASGVQGCLPVI